MMIHVSKSDLQMSKFLLPTQRKHCRWVERETIQKGVNTVAAKSAEIVQVEKGAFTIQRSTTGEKLAMSEEFRKAVIDFINGSEEKRIALTLEAAFKKYKRITDNGLPAFVHEHIDETCPKGYGAPGSDERKKINAHTVFNGVDHLIKKVRRPL